MKQREEGRAANEQQRTGGQQQMFYDFAMERYGDGAVRG